MKNNSAQKVAYLFILAFLWGSSYLFTKVSVNEIPMLTYSLGRTAVGALILWVMLRLTGQQLPRLGRVWFHISVMALVHIAAPYVLIAWGSLTLDSSLAALITSTAPLFTIILAHYMVSDDRMTPGKLLGVFIAISGIYVLLGPSFNSGIMASLTSVLAVLAASLCYGVSNVYTRKYLLGLTSLVGPASQLMVATIFLLPISLFWERPFGLPIPSAGALLAWLVAAVFSTAVAFIIFYRLLEIATPSYVSTVSYLIPIVGAILGVVVLSERLSWNAYAGFGIILVGVMIANDFLNPQFNPVLSHLNRIIHLNPGLLTRKGESHASLRS